MASGVCVCLPFRPWEVQGAGFVDLPERSWGVQAQLSLAPSGQAAGSLGRAVLAHEGVLEHGAELAVRMGWRGEGAGFTGGGEPAWSIAAPDPVKEVGRLVRLRRVQPWGGS